MFCAVSNFCLIRRIILKIAFVSDDSRRLKQIGSGRVMKSTRHENRDGAKFMSFSNQLSDDLMVRIDPLAVILAFNTERPAVVAELQKIAWRRRSVHPNAVRRLCFAKAALSVFRLVKVERALIRKSGRARSDLVETFKNDNLKGVASEISKPPPETEA